MLYRTQCTQVIRGAAGSGASGSSTISARLFVPAGTPVHAREGETSFPSQVCNFGIGPFAANAVDAITNPIAFSSARGVLELVTSDK
jgi:hypothetical protein